MVLVTSMSSAEFDISFSINLFSYVSLADYDFPLLCKFLVR